MLFSAPRKEKLTHTKWHVIFASSLISARDCFLNACSCWLTPGFAFLSFARTAVGPGHTNEKCQASSGNSFLKGVHLRYLYAGMLLKEPLDWKHSTGKRNGSSHPAPASSLLLWGTAVGNQRREDDQWRDGAVLARGLHHAMACLTTAPFLM